MNDMTVRQEEIVNKSLEIIIKKGIQAMTLKNIANEVGVTDAAIYKHFKSKSEIFIGITELFRRDSTALLAELMSEKIASILMLEKFFLNRCRIFSKNKLLSIILFSDDLFTDDKTLLKKIHSIMEEHGNLLAVSIKEGQKNDEIRNDVVPEHIFMIMMGALRLHVVKWRASGFSFDLYKQGEKLWQSLRKMIALNI
jgi:AcrR family transcriptional regulator